MEQDIEYIKRKVSKLEGRVEDLLLEINDIQDDLDLLKEDLVNHG